MPFQQKRKFSGGAGGRRLKAFDGVGGSRAGNDVLFIAVHPLGFTTVIQKAPPSLVESLRSYQAASKLQIHASRYQPSKNYGLELLASIGIKRTTL
jgi:hypothetical protein